MPLPHIAPATTKLANVPSATGNLNTVFLINQGTFQVTGWCISEAAWLQWLWMIILLVTSKV
jgi:hypothetical protein